MKPLLRLLSHIAHRDAKAQRRILARRRHLQSEYRDARKSHERSRRAWRELHEATNEQLRRELGR